MWTATTAQAAPDDTNASTSAGPSTSSDDSESKASASSDSESRSTTKSTRAAKNSKESDDSDDSDAADRDKDSESVADSEVDDTDVDDTEVDDDGDEAGPGTVPASTRANSAETLVTLDVDDDEEDDVDAPADTDTVDLALEQITDAREDLKEATWDSGNFLAGLASLLPQMWLGGAHASLERWQLNHSLLQQQYADTAENTFAHWIAGQRIEASIQRTIRVQDQLEAAEKFLPVVGLFGPRAEMAAIAELINQASDNGLVYQILDVYMEDSNGIPRVNPIIKLSINGGDYVNVLLDTGSYGLIINPQVIGLENLGPIVGHGEGCYADCSTPYEYDVYKIPVSVDEDVDSTPTRIQVVTLNTWYALSETNSDYEGILGIGPNSGGPGTSNPLAGLPGLLGNGILMDPRRNRAILGPNPYAARVTLDGAPINTLRVKIGDYDEQVIETWIDSGGLNGTIAGSLVDGATSLPNGTLITVYTEDGDKLFSYRTSGKDTPAIDQDAENAILGSTPFAVTPIYTDFTNGGRLVFNYA
ncbi:PecA family PE domain-processing aspartic protease [Mycobacterium sp. 236(2023)]|uniref:PecA family PE domain-processing aspartic protease n=1 Tax=Mycobacterium sp. 236(2023) TaxID=3038163 RepID=UPI0024152A4D|nr:PecA family PE domain-processing aspartic protease [Mycobacterium sp. 236(2023)]MDG4665947.1 PecA family PE domain-processing aspartic protease [Mycobacterium sp. 236(2023)]